MTPPADDVTPPSDEGSATGSCDAPVDANASKYAARDASKIYNNGDTVSFDHLVWKAKYWTQGNQPGFGVDAWELVSNVKMNWRSDWSTTAAIPPLTRQRLPCQMVDSW